MAAVADHKKIKLEAVDVRIDYRIQTGKSWSTCFGVRIDPGKNLTRRERTILFNSARGCEVAKLLGGENRFEYELAALTLPSCPERGSR